MILNTRPGFYQDRFHAAFAELGLPILDCPVLRPEATDAELPDPRAFDAVILTSQVAVAQFSAAGLWLSKKAYAVGPGTEEAARMAGFGDVVCTGVDAADMEQYLADQPFEMALYASAEDVAKDLSEVFPKRVRRLPVYRMVPLNEMPASVLSVVKANAQIIVPLFSRRSAETVTTLFGKAQVTATNSRLYAVGISHDIFAGIEGPWQCRAVAPSPTLEAMVAATREVAADIGLISKVMQ